ncbi:MAG: GNAT family N-acetyltransferase [Acidimicrobiales bacterium]
MEVLRTARLTLRQMSPDDLDEMAALLGDPEVMRYYPAPKSRDQARAWIDWNLENYQRYGFGLWIVETVGGEFVGDCGLTMQTVEGRQDVEVGYHVRAGMQGNGFATESAAACRDYAASLGVERLIAIIAPENGPSQRVAMKLGLILERAVDARDGQLQLIYSTRLASVA